MVMRAFLVDDESLALKRLQRMLAVTGRVEIAGTSMDPVEAVEAIVRTKPDVLFLDIEMPGMTGFQMLSKLDPQPLIELQEYLGRVSAQWDQVLSRLKALVER